MLYFFPVKNLRWSQVHFAWFSKACHIHAAFRKPISFSLRSNVYIFIHPGCSWATFNRASTAYHHSEAVTKATAVTSISASGSCSDQGTSHILTEESIPIGKAVFAPF